VTRAALLLAVTAGCTVSPSPAHGWVRVAHVQAGPTTSPVVLGDSWAFVANMGDGTVTQIDRASGKVVARIAVADTRLLREKDCAPTSVHAYYSGSWGWRDCNSPYAMAYGDSSLWAIDNGRDRLVRIDPHLHAAVDQVNLPGSGWGIAISGTTAWVSGNEAANSLYQVDLRQHRVVATIGDLDDGTAAVVAGPNAVWVLCARAGTGHLDRVDPVAARVTARYPIEWWSPTAVMDAGAVYIRGTFGSDISRVNADTGAVEWKQPGPGFLGPAGIDELGLTKDGLWMSGPSTVRIDPTSGRTVETLRTTSASVAAAPNELWLVLLDGSVAEYRRS
jgi:hypothetical protein